MIKTAQVAEETKTLTESAYRLIRGDILAGLVAPKDKLQIYDLGRRHGTSASAIREALSRLVSEGLVTTEEQKGFRVAPMSVGEFKEITDLRVMLETQALRRALTARTAALRLSSLSASSDDDPFASHHDRVDDCDIEVVHRLLAWP